MNKNINLKNFGIFLIILGFIIGIFLTILFNISKDEEDVSALVEPSPVVVILAADEGFGEADLEISAPPPQSLGQQTPAPLPAPGNMGVCSLDEMLSQAGVAEADWPTVNRLIFKESTCNHLAKNPNSSAVGLCQAMASVHALPVDYLTDPVVQLKWCDNYAQQRYGGWTNAWAFWQQNRWW